jgi:hypothetical protein
MKCIHTHIRMHIKGRRHGQFPPTHTYIHTHTQIDIHTHVPSAPLTHWLLPACCSPENPVLLARLPEEKERAEKERPLCVCVCVGGSAGTACRSLSMFLPITLASPSACVKGWRHMVNPTRFFTLGYNKHGPALYAHSGGVIRSTKNTAVWTRHILSKKWGAPSARASMGPSLQTQR